MHPPQVGFVHGRIDRFRHGQPRLLVRRDSHVDLPGDLPCDCAVHGHHVSDHGVVRLRPDQSLLRHGLDEAHAQADRIPGSCHRRLHHRIHAQLPRDLGDRLIARPVPDRGPLRDHPQRADLRELGDQGVVHPVDEILLVRISREVRGRQHRHGQLLAAKAPIRTHRAEEDGGQDPTADDDGQQAGLRASDLLGPARAVVPGQDHDGGQAGGQEDHGHAGHDLAPIVEGGEEADGLENSPGGRQVADGPLDDLSLDELFDG